MKLKKALDRVRQVIREGRLKQRPSVSVNTADMTEVLKSYDRATEHDYRTLLVKYMQHVGQCEGTDFVARINECAQSEVKFSEDDHAALLKISNHLKTTLWEVQDGSY